MLHASEPQGRDVAGQVYSVDSSSFYLSRLSSILGTLVNIRVFAEIVWG